MELIPELEEVRHGTEALAGEVPGQCIPTARPKEPTELEKSFALYGISEVESLLSVSVSFVMML